ncbi:T9SS type A sorting domain-containing protein [Oceanihabitans sp. 2_MG-2023]|uniref:T9SS type A sorting domain-containing protein n=1 Tax=Flavobacteriaceae TaxID=49546 RepID=UPI0026E3E09D|nr:T9SS type A sorting domain-containing protein [Oceanihabitans sp. 2_MG-2023]MDO6598494.1 T9SS type A sorting domain-containing protein [Oceanihabitans sp. 2_MG-2023]
MKTKLLYIIFIFFSQLIFAQTTYVPDDNFEQHLINLGYDDVLDDYVLTANINTVTAVGINNKNISDLTGIEDFTALEFLTCEFNQLTSLDLTQNTSLEFLRCNSNQISGELDLSQNTSLWQVDCHQNFINTLTLPATTTLSIVNAHYNELSSVDFSNVPQLTQLDLRVNQIPGALDFTPHTMLWDLNVSVNPITSITLPNNSSMLFFSCGGTQITTLDASQQSVLQSISCSYNPLLTSLNVKNNNNTNIGLYFFADNNPLLTCIQVDDVDYSNTNWTNIDSQHYFSEDCSNLSVGEFDEINVDLFPNPVIDKLFLTFKTSEKINYQLINLNGQLLFEGKFNEQNDTVNLSRIPSGIYFLKLETLNRSIVKKIIKR